MKDGHAVSRITYNLGWLAALIAFVYKVLTFTQPVLSLASRTQITPRHFFNAAVLLFIFSMASVAQGFEMGRELARTSSARGAA